MTQKQTPISDCFGSFKSTLSFAFDFLRSNITKNIFSPIFQEKKNILGAEYTASDQFSQLNDVNIIYDAKTISEESNSLALSSLVIS